MNRTYLKTRDGQTFAVDDEGLIHISSNDNNHESVYDKILKQAKIISASYWALWCIFQNDKLSLLIPSSNAPLNDQVVTNENQVRTTTFSSFFPNYKQIHLISSLYV
jgi:hypothetical protein